MRDNTTLEKRYEPVEINLSDLSKEIDRLWLQLLTDGSGVRAKAAKAGIDIDQLRSYRRVDVIDVRREGEGLAEVAVIVAFIPVAKEFAKELAPVVADIARDLWNEIFLPHLRRKFGTNAFREKVDKRKKRK